MPLKIDVCGSIDPNAKNTKLANPLDMLDVTGIPNVDEAHAKLNRLRNERMKLHIESAQKVINTFKEWLTNGLQLDFTDVEYESAVSNEAAELVTQAFGKLGYQIIKNPVSNAHNSPMWLLTLHIPKPAPKFTPRH